MGERENYRDKSKLYGSERIKRLSKKTSWNKVCQDLEADVRDT